MTIFLNLTNLKTQGKLINTLQNVLTDLCQTHNILLKCKFTLKITRVLLVKIVEKKDLIFNLVGHRGKRNITTKIAKALQLIYGTYV